MNILFIYPVAYTASYQEGVASISAVLKQAGHRVKLLISNKLDKLAISAYILGFRPQMVLIHCMTNQFPLAKKMIDFIFKEYALPIVLGGYHPTIAPDEALAAKGVFAICIGEGEEPILELAEAMERESDYTNIKNLWFKKENRIIKNGLRPLISDLDALPLPDRDLFSLYVKGKKIIDTSLIFFLRSRGCIYNCSYCGFNVWHAIHGHTGRRYRSKSVDRVIHEIKSTLEKYGRINPILFEDAIFTIDEAWLSEFSYKYSRKIKLPFVCSGHPKHINKKIVSLLKKAGCILIPIAIESGNDFIRKEIMGRDIEKKEILDAVKTIQNAGVRTMCWILLGAPYETEDTIQETIEFLKSVNPDQIFTSIFRPFPGTELFDLCDSKGWISSRTVQSLNDTEYILDQPSISREKVIWYYRNYFLQRPTAHRGYLF